MDRKIAGIAIVALLLFAAFFIGSRRSRMVGGAGTNLPLAAVSANGEQIPLSAEVEAVAGKLAGNAAAQQVGDLVVTFSMNPYPATIRQLTDFEVTLKEADGQAVNDAAVRLDMTMPEMWMPPNQFALEFASDGQYRATGQFTMRGWWRIEVIISRGGVDLSAFFDVGL